MISIYIRDPIGKDKSGKPVLLSEIWPSQREVSDAVQKSITSDMFRKSYADVYQGDERWRGLPVPKRRGLRLDVDSTYIRQAPYFDGMTIAPRPVQDIVGRACWPSSEIATTDHISPAGSIEEGQPRRKILAGSRSETGGF